MVVAGISEHLFAAWFGPELPAPPVRTREMRSRHLRERGRASHGWRSVSSPAHVSATHFSLPCSLFRSSLTKVIWYLLSDLLGSPRGDVSPRPTWPVQGGFPRSSTSISVFPPPLFPKSPSY